MSDEHVLIAVRDGSAPPAPHTQPEEGDTPTTERITSCDTASAITREILEAEPFQANVFSAWSDGYAAGLLDLQALTHRAYERGKREAAVAPAVGWLAGCCFAFLLGFAVCAAAFA